MDSNLDREEQDYSLSPSAGVSSPLKNRQYKKKYR
jgi:hypothetical protein